MSLPSPTPVNAARLEAVNVFVRGLEIQAAIGVHDHEQGRRQPLVIDVELEMIPHPVEVLTDTLNYEAVAAAARALAAGGHIGLVETFAQRLAEAMTDDPRVRRVRVRVAKPEALPGAEAAGCELVLAR